MEGMEEEACRCRQHLGLAGMEGMEEEEGEEEATAAAKWVMEMSQRCCSVYSGS